VLTEAGRELVPVLAALTAWGDRWATPAGGPPVVFRHRSCGHRFKPRVACSQCGKAVTAAELEFLPGPGALSAPGTLLSGRRGQGNRRLARSDAAALQSGSPQPGP